ncbi:MAG: putative transport system permease protein [Candidatus Eremiobacteraeota bacterium]|nr:putative transport system permease protein [Candidatus Eremiobacteraeota bacterium]
MTRLGAYLTEAFSAIWRNRTRSILTMLGMIIGTSSIIAVLGISRAASGGIASTLASFGDPGFSVAPDPNQDDPRAAAMQYRDVRTIEANAGPLIKHIEPSYARTMTLRAKTVTASAFVVSDSEFHPDTLQMREGRRIGAQDLATAAHVCVLSAPLADRLFGTAPAVGELVRIGGPRCTIVGVLAEIKGGFFASIAGSEFLQLPYTTYHDMFPGPIDQLQVYAADGVSIAQAGDAISAVLRRLHGERAKYDTQDNTAALGTFNVVLGVTATGLTAIGGVALLVAGIGIMNIMLVSVTERTREIGLRKAIGAKRGDVALQFLLEAVLLSFMGGGIGTLFGFLATLLAYRSVEALVGPAPIPYLLIILVAVGFSAFVGCVFGTYPAIRAARLDPITALRA